MVGWAMVKEVLGETNSLPGHRCTLGTTPRCPLFLASLHGITAPCFKTQERQRGRKHIRTMYILRRPRWFLRQHPAERSRGVPQRHRSGRPGLQSGFPGCQDYCSLNLCLFPSCKMHDSKNKSYLQFKRRSLLPRFLGLSVTFARCCPQASSSLSRSSVPSRRLLVWQWLAFLWFWLVDFAITPAGAVGLVDVAT